MYYILFYIKLKMMNTYIFIQNGFHLHESNLPITSIKKYMYSSKNIQN